MDYAAVRTVHEAAVTLSIAGFFARGVLALRDSPLSGTRVAKTLPHIVDTVLLLAGVTLAWMAGLTPVNAPWIAAKIAGLVVYIGLGTIALRPGRPQAVRAAAWAGALATVAWIVSVAITKDPAGFLRPIVAG